MVIDGERVMMTGGRGEETEWRGVILAGRIDGGGEGVRVRVRVKHMCGV